MSDQEAFQALTRSAASLAMSHYSSCSCSMQISYQYLPIAYFSYAICQGPLHICPEARVLLLSPQTHTANVRRDCANDPTGSLNVPGLLMCKESLQFENMSKNSKKNKLIGACVCNFWMLCLSKA